MREQNAEEEAAQLEKNDLANAVRDIRLKEGLEALTEAELQGMFVTEEQRVADAAILAELLAPRLALPAAVATGPKPTLAPVRESEVPVSFSRVAAPAPGGTGIPDLLDAMLAADKASRRPTTGRHA